MLNSELVYYNNTLFTVIVIDGDNIFYSFEENEKHYDFLLLCDLILKLLRHNTEFANGLL